MSKRRAAIEIVDATPPGRPPGERPWLGVSPAELFGTSPGEQNRIAREAALASKLVGEASPAQAELMARLVRAAPEGRLRFPSVGQLKRFLAATAPHDAGAAGISDQDLTALWRDAASLIRN